MQKIDSHQHFWKYSPRRHSWISEEMGILKNDFLPNSLEPILRANNMDGSVVVQVEHSEDDTNFLLSLAGRHNFIKGVVGWVDLAAENVAERLTYFAEDPKFKGIRHTVYDEGGEFLLEKNFLRGLRQLGDLDLAFDLLIFPYQLNSAVQLLREVPNQRFVLNHFARPEIAAGPTAEWERSIFDLAQAPNICCKLSGMFPQGKDLSWKQEELEPFLDLLVEAFGTDRLLFGSDWPVSTCAASYEETLGVLERYFGSFSTYERQAIFGGNSTEFYKL